MSTRARNRPSANGALKHPGKDVVNALSLEVSRRGFLKGTLAGSALLAGSSLLPQGCARYAPPGAPLEVFDAKEFAVLAAAADRIVGEGLAPEPSPSEAGVAAQIDAAFAFAPGGVQSQVKQMLQIFEHGTQIFFFSFKRFTELTPEEKDDYIRTWMDSGLAFRKTVFWAMKKIAFAFYYSTPAVWPSIDYDGPWIGRAESAGRGWAEKQLRDY
ncbi:MAG: gluconate 2-dehydrogenase subunit 3 family protein [Myxococcota bacterium]